MLKFKKFIKKLNELAKSRQNISRNCAMDFEDNPFVYWTSKNQKIAIAAKLRLFSFAFLILSDLRSRLN
jgi:hypothetical protein